MAVYFLTYLLSLMLSVLLIPVVIRVASEKNLMDIPNARSVHKQPIARLGGIAIFLSFLIAVVFIFLVQDSAFESFKGEWLLTCSLLFGSTVMFLVGLWDDLKTLGVRPKLCAQVVGALIMSLAGARVTHITAQDLFSINLGWMSYPITFFWIIGITNSINLIDGVDGLAGGISMIACVGVAVLSVLQGNWVLAIMMFGLLGSLTGFLFYNFHPARIFMGDCGSLFLGFILAGATLITASKTKSLIGIGLPILVLSIPIFDTIFSMLRRFLERRGLMSPDSGHFHHKLLERGFKQHEVAITAYAVTVIISGLGMFMLVTRGVESILLFGTCLILVILVFRAAGAIRLRDTLRGLRSRSELLQLQIKERKVFEEVQLDFRKATNHEEWWHCMCMAATAMDFASAAFELSQQNQEPRILMWNNSKYPESDSKEKTLRIQIPMLDRRRESISTFSVEIPTDKSLESAGRKVALLARLAEEHGLHSLFGSDEETSDILEDWISADTLATLSKTSAISNVRVRSAQRGSLV